jgi:hypothetical protein
VIIAANAGFSRALRAGRIIVQGEARRQWWRSADAPTLAAGVPFIFTIEGSSLKVSPVDNTALELQ